MHKNFLTVCRDWTPSAFSWAYIPKRNIGRLYVGDLKAEIEKDKSFTQVQNVY
jgi:hypothetical protein